jgi:copper oxidase (laccase) domain-containing protein
MNKGKEGTETAIRWEQFPGLENPLVWHGFSLRSRLAGGPFWTALRRTLRHMGLPAAHLVEAGQPHGNRVAIVRSPKILYFPEADGLLTSLPGVVLLVRVADCAAVYLFDPVRRVVGLLHSGRRGTAWNIVGAAIGCMKQGWGSRPCDIRMQISPCIRPPCYEVDFASEIVRQARREGVIQITDCGICTATHPERYDSYRRDRGKTGRMCALIMLRY